MAYILPCLCISRDVEYRSFEKQVARGLMVKVEVEMKPLVEAHPVWSKFTKIVEIEREIIDDGLSSVSVAEDNDIKIWAENGAVRIQNATNEQLRAQIYLISGQTIYDGTEQTIKLPKGLYIVKVGNKTEKIQVQ